MTTGSANTENPNGVPAGRPRHANSTPQASDRDARNTRMHSTQATADRQLPTGSTLPNLALFQMQKVVPALDGPEAGRFVMPTETTCRHWCADTLRMSAQCLGLFDAHECGSRSNPVNGSRIVTLEPSPSVCAAAEIVWIRSSVRFP